MLPELEDRISNAPGRTTSTNARWVRFVDDHIRYLLERSNIQELDIDDLAVYRHRPKFLMEEHNIDEEDTWLVLRINNIEIANGIPLHYQFIYVPEYDALAWVKEQFVAQVGAEK